MTRRKHTSTFKSQVALEAIRGENTIAEIASRHNVHPGQVQNWKASALSNFTKLFEGSSKLIDNSEEKVSVLQRKVGELTIENDFLKKSCTISPKRRSKKW
ncbi:MAG: transposase [Alphaproteobacteria bacterium]|jgi:transposase|nr:transposase [Alphaproteobacteria bacterium]